MRLCRLQCPALSGIATVHIVSGSQDDAPMGVDVQAVQSHAQPRAIQ